MHFNAKLKDSKGNLTEWSSINSPDWLTAQSVAQVRFEGIEKGRYKLIILCKAVNFNVVDCSLFEFDKNQWTVVETRSLVELLKNC